jgi:hypothetical protein
MAKGSDKNHVSIWFWIGSMIVMAIPLVNLVMVLVWAFMGENESRKNYFKACIIVFLFWTAVAAVLLLCGFLPVMIDFVKELRHRHWHWR